MTVRDIVHIDQEKCDGCGLCVPSCEEGAIQIIGSKARVVSDVYCDGLGACLGHCPQDAISIVRREAIEFDEQAVARHLTTRTPVASTPAVPIPGCDGGCSAAAALQPGPTAEPVAAAHSDSPQAPSQLANWPVQLHLVPPHAPFLHRADLLLVADCVPFACANFHTQVLDGRPVVIGCPKLDDCHFYVAKLAAMIQQAQIQSISVIHMEVPCCTGLLRVAEAAIAQAGAPIPLRHRIVTRRGEIGADKSAQTARTAGISSAATPNQLHIL